MKEVSEEPSSRASGWVWRWSQDHRSPAGTCRQVRPPGDSGGPREANAEVVEAVRSQFSGRIADALRMEDKTARQTIWRR